MAARAPRRRLRQNDPAGTRELILEEATRIIGRSGVEELRLKDIADAVGIQTPSIYRHFTSREAIISTLARSLTEELADFLTPEEEIEPQAWMEKWARGLVLFFAARPAYVRMMLRDLSTPDGFEPFTAAFGPVENTTQVDLVIRINQSFARVYGRGVEAETFKPGLHSSFFSLIFGAILVSLAWPYSGAKPSVGAADIERLQEQAVAIVNTLLRA